MVYSAPNHPHENIEIAAPKPKEENSLLTRMLAMKKDAKEYSATRYGYFNAGINWQIQPFDSKKLTINIATYYVPDPKWGAVTLKHFTMGDVSEGWRND